MTTADTDFDVARTQVRALVADGHFGEAWSSAAASLVSTPSTAAGSAARNVLRMGERAGFAAPTSRTVRLAVLSSYEASELADGLRLAGLALRIEIELYTAPFGQIDQELLNPDAGLTGFSPTHVLIAPSERDLGLPELAEDPGALIEASVQRWRGLWEHVRRDHGARVLQHGFVVSDESPFGHLAWRMPGSRESVLRELNRRVGEAAGDDVLLIDCERLASRLGKDRWCDPRLWYAARRPYGADALWWLARDTAAMLAADVGLGARCLVVDLDNTLWGGVVGEDGVDGIQVGTGPEGEAFSAFQDYVGALRRRGVVLAVASKNDLATAQEPFRRRKGMRLGLDDFAAFVADWRRKPEQIAEIAERLGLGLEHLVFADDNPAECAEVAAALPEVTVVRLDVAPSELVRTLSGCPRFEVPALSEQDSARQRSYAARTQAAQLRDATASLEDFWRSLQMRARVAPVDGRSLPRAAQLVQKTNQFNLTLRRHTRAEIEALCDDERTICLTLELEDRFADHGLIGLGLVVPGADDAATAEIDTLLLSCRVIGRTAERHLLVHLMQAASRHGYTRLRGLYVPGPRNALVAELYASAGFQAGDRDGVWEYDLSAGPIASPYIEVIA
jgi:FkbH-like protein